MTFRDIAWRMAGIGLCAAAGGASLIHRDVLHATGHQPATVLEAVLGLASFAFASMGVLLLCQGARLRDSWRADMQRQRAQREGRAQRAPASGSRFTAMHGTSRR